MRILYTEKEVDVFVVNNENFRYDFLIGLDLIREFHLIQNEDLQITQNTSLKVKEKIEVDENPKTTEKNNSIENRYNTLSHKVNTELLKMKEDVKYEEQEILINFNEHVNEKDFEVKINHLSTPQKDEIDRLIDKYDSIFAKDKYDVGTVKDYEARIDLTIDKYCSKRPYRCSLNDKKEIENQIAHLLKKKLIEESYSPFAAPVTLVYKKEEEKKSRLCINFRDLNKIVVPQAQHSYL